MSDRSSSEPDRSRKKVHSPTVTMATGKGRRCRAELGKGGRKDKGKEREAGEKGVSPSFFFYPSCSLCAVYQHIKS